MISGKAINTKITLLNNKYDITNLGNEIANL